MLAALRALPADAGNKRLEFRHHPMVAAKELAYFGKHYGLAWLNCWLVELGAQ